MADLQKSTLPPLPDEWVERIFQRMENYYLSLWKDRFGTFPRERVKQAWAEELAGYTANEIKRGLDAAKGMKFPPTLPEFLTACRPPLDAKISWAEACEQMRIRLQGKGDDRWTSPKVYWAAVKIGAYDLNNLSWDQVRARWNAAISEGRADPIPEFLAQLPAPGHQTVTRKEATERMSELKAKIGQVSLPGTTKAGTQWAYRLMEREAKGESLPHVSKIGWREALGYPMDTEAKTAMERAA